MTKVPYNNPSDIGHELDIRQTCQWPAV